MLGTVLTLAAACLAMVWLAPRLNVDAAATVSLLLIALFSPAIWGQALHGYPGDSYWTLGLWGRAGVLAISLIAITFFYAALWMLFRRLAPMPRAFAITGVGVVGFVLLHALMPQVFYSFYRLLFPDLPQQWVITGLPDPARLRAIASIRTGGSLSDHLSATALWGIVPFAVWSSRRG